MSKGTRTYITVHSFTQEDFAELDQVCDCGSSNFFECVVPFKHEWGEVAHMELEDLDYCPQDQQLTVICETKWHAPARWIQASSATSFFQNKLVTAATVTRDESYVSGIACMDHDILQERVLLDVDPSVIGELYQNDEVDEVDEMIWTPVRSFEEECEDLYIKKGIL